MPYRRCCCIQLRNQQHVWVMQMNYRAFHNVLRECKHLQQENQRTY